MREGRGADKSNALSTKPTTTCRPVGSALVSTDKDMDINTLGTSGVLSAIHCYTCTCVCPTSTYPTTMPQHDATKSASARSQFLGLRPIPIIRQVNRGYSVEED
ncbi:hypothetical protein E2C01_033959 [Portunus trituberculatus]|uniref:Uncharacterized protein n=1 Tax=Portunus trituberculatus TaxID=210409 RepID=A0A5B7F1J0_PORTR|nr:hypothetical protein [Portunus trituberculatus]